MKLIIAFICVGFSFQCYGQKLDSLLGISIQSFLAQDSSKRNTAKYKTTLMSGTFATQTAISNKRTGTIDSDRGELSSKNSLIYYDIGGMAGAHMHLKRKPECTWYLEDTINDYKTCIGLITEKGKQNLVVTIWGNYQKNSYSFPANFWATVNNKKDIETMLEIIFSYKPIK